MLRRPAQFQVAALCYRIVDGAPQVLLITSRETRRWVLPKGWPMAGLDAAGAAIQEAWEEAGVRPCNAAAPRRLGQYRYTKILKGGMPALTDVDVFAVPVKTVHDTYPEVGQRDRLWTSPADAADKVDELGLKDLLHALPERLATPAAA
ncbi:MAG: NUDIX hydrolase [Rhodobacteraceae bacterium]|nr:NUDIX hydrolase [Paracoccaceae bacterium]